MGDYVSPVYDPIGPIKSFRGVPRFGHTSDLTDIFADDGTLDMNMLKDYVMGSIFVAAFLLATFVVFVLAVLIFKMMGAKAGIMAGHPFLENVKLIFRSRPRKHIIIRAVVLFLTITVVAGGGVFLLKGTQQVRIVAEDVRDGTTGFKAVAQKVVDTADMMIAFGNSSMTLRDNLIDVIDEGVCQSFEGGNANPQDEFDNAASSLVEVLNEMQNFATNELVEIRDVFATDIVAMAHRISNTTDTTEIAANPTYYAVPAMALGSILFIGAVLAWTEVGFPGYFCIQTWFFMPLFLLLIFTSIIVITAVGAVLVANSDFCIGTPEGTPEGTLKHVLDIFDLDNETMSALNYYVIGGCRGEYDQLTAVEDLLAQLDEGTTVARDLQLLIDQRQNQFEMACGGQPGSLNPLLNTLGLTIEAFDEVLEIGNSTTDLLSCEDINSIWIDIVHEAVCTSAPSAFTWMFSSITGVYAAGIFVYMLRGALLPAVDIKDVEGWGEDDSTYANAVLY